jgi:uncharacterized protein with HEPN domain
LPEDLKQSYATIPGRQVADIGNRLRHGYGAVNTLIVWNIVCEDIPVLKSAITAAKISWSEKPEGEKP